MVDMLCSWENLKFTVSHNLEFSIYRAGKPKVSLVGKSNSNL